MILRNINIEQMFQGATEIKNKNIYQVCAHEFWSSPNKKTRYNVVNFCLVFLSCIYEYWIFAMVTLNTTKLVFLQHYYLVALTVSLTDCGHLRAKIQDSYFSSASEHLCKGGVGNRISSKPIKSKIKLLQQPLSFFNKEQGTEIAWVSISISKPPDRIFPVLF